ncbi:DUF3993 domain-containing protein [Neobacillus sp. 179-C4.2 HS]|uniref:DUF3993 domain-containing protein n=1 Tax=Neobacillus driksii TaxID=3035913 RepID=A0ABV4YVN1_9BACI|nr:DUF3993 domain-containing protein [Neobacillus sp. 179.-C4.2 HS]MDP5192326.1 DUF3993 domain-containing protein [Neobacillus sp. 179.-C4.2 HS]
MKKTLLILFIVLLLIPLSPNAKDSLSDKNDVFSFLQKAFQAQISLSDQTRTKQEIRDVLSPYFSEEYQKMFWDENMFEEEGKFVTYGSDFAFYYIPFFQYSGETKVVISPESIYVLQFFPPTTDGPVSYEDHYEGIMLKKMDGSWKIADYLYDNIPKSIIEKAY